MSTPPVRTGSVPDWERELLEQDPLRPRWVPQRIERTPEELAEADARREERQRQWAAATKLRLAAVNAAVEGLTFTEFGGDCPCQGYGSYQNFTVYYRFRSDNASLECYASDEAFNEGERPVLVSFLPGVTGTWLEGSYLGEPRQTQVLQELVAGLVPHDKDNPSGAERLMAAVEGILGASGTLPKKG